MTDYNNGNGEKLIEQRNESSVLFSLDSLSSMGDDNEEEQGSFGGSGDKSGLIDLNTLAAMGESSGGDDEFGGAAPVFNSVASKSEKRNLAIIISVVVIALIGLGVGAYMWYQNMQASQAEQERLVAEQQAKAQKEADELRAQLNAAELANKELEANAQRREADQAKLQAALAEQDAKRAAADDNAAAAAAAPSGSTKKPTSGSKTGSSAPAALPAPPAAPKGKGPSKDEVMNALKASNTKAAKCGKGGNLVVSMTLTSAGKATKISAVSGSFKGTPTEKCILTVVEKHNFPEFSGAAVSGVKWNYKL